MTGFGRASATASDCKITVELKSLNSKQFDLSSRIPQMFRPYEVELRNALAAQLERGKVDLNVSVEMAQGTASARVNASALAAARNQVAEAAAAAGVPEPADWWSVLLRFPEVLTSEQPEADEAAAAALRTAVKEAADALMNYRRAEGVKLEQFFAARIQAISDLLREVPRWENERIERIRTNLTEGLKKIAVADYDKGRLEQEMIYYIEKLDVNEEKQRLSQHLEYFMETMNLPKPGQGKKLGFIAQEMGREINTLGSKSNHAEMQMLVVRMKDQLEQIKEQVLNVM